MSQRESVVMSLYSRHRARSRSFRGDGLVLQRRVWPRLTPASGHPSPSKADGEGPEVENVSVSARSTKPGPSPSAFDGEGWPEAGVRRESDVVELAGLFFEVAVSPDESSPDGKSGG